MIPVDATSTATAVLSDATTELEGVLVGIAPGLVALAATFWAVRLVMRKTKMNQGAKL